MGGQTMQAVVSFEGAIGKSVHDSVKKLNSSIGGISKKALATTAIIATAAAGIGAAAYKAGKALFDLGEEFQDAYKTIRIGTGATGESLKSLNKDFKAVFSSVPADMKDAAQAIADYNTRLGLSGEELQDVSKQALLLSNNLGAGNLNSIIEKSSQAFTAWNIPAAEMSKEMDFIFKASQSTGMSFENLAQYAQQNAQTFQALGYDFETTVTLIGQMEKSGLNVTDVFSGMKKSVQEISKNGQNAADVFKDYYAQISQATTETEAINLATKIFGTKNAPAMAAAIRAGKIDVAQLAGQLHNSTENIEDLAWETMKVGDKFTVLKNKTKVAFEPLAAKLMDLINKYLPTVISSIEKMLPYINKTASYIKLCAKMAISFVKVIKDNWGIIAPIVIGITTALIAYKTTITAISIGHKIAAAAQALYSTSLVAGTGAATAATGATTALGAAIAFVTSPIFLACAAIGLLVAAGYLLYKNWDQVCEGAEILGQQIAEVWETVKTKVIGTISAIWSGIKNTFSKVVNFIKSNWKMIILGALNPFSLIVPFVGKVMNNLINKFGIIDKVKNIFGNIWGYITGGFSNLGSSIFGKLTGIFSKIGDYIKSNWKTILIGALNPIGLIGPELAILFKNILDNLGISEKLSSVFSTVKETIKTIWAGVTDFIIAPFKQVVEFANQIAPNVAAGFNVLVNLITNPVETIKLILNGVINTAKTVWTTITNGFSNMAAGISATFTNVFSGLSGIIAAPIRAVVGLINKAIDGINSISVSIPDWVPGFGGKTFGVNIPRLPEFATGGFTQGASIAGEAGTEAIISFNKQYRTENLGYLATAAQMLGVGTNSFATDSFLSNLTGNDLISNSINNSSAINITYSPNVTMNGAQELTESGITSILRKHANDLADQIQEILKDREGANYGNTVY